MQSELPKTSLVETSRNAERYCYGNVFLSSTRDDMHGYRMQLSTIVHESLFLPVPNDELDGHRVHLPVIDVHLRQARFYFGVFGFRYGTLISDDPDSISYVEYEYQRALQLLADTQIRIFLPLEGSEFCQEVQLLAELYAKRDYGHDQDRIKLDTLRQRDFLRLVSHVPMEMPEIEAVIDTTISPAERRQRSLQRSVNKIANKDQLAARAKCILLVERLARQDIATPVAPSAKFVPALDQMGAAPEPPSLPSSEWEVIQSRLEEWRQLMSSHNAGPGLCLVLTGSKDNIALSRELHDRNPWRVDRDDGYYLIRSKDGRQERAVDFPCRCIYAYFKQNVDMSRYNVEDLAAMLFEVAPPYMFTFCNINLNHGALRGFIEDLWHPLYDALQRHQQKQAPADRKPILLMVVTSNFVLTGDHLLRHLAARAEDFRNPVLVDLTGTRGAR